MLSQLSLGFQGLSFKAGAVGELFEHITTKFLITLFDRLILSFQRMLLLHGTTN
jgi:hypothetical protein